tara:strand:+ start:263 stop:655 length:393 start_codon:yes stop_codon:yes gene_type:complete
MASKSKAKGNRFEYLIRDITQEIGLKCQRAWGSDGRSLGWHEEVDLLIDNTIKVQAKCRKAIANWMLPSAEVDIQVIKEDRGIPLVVESYDTWIDRIKELKDLKKQIKGVNNDNVNGTNRKRARKPRKNS